MKINKIYNELLTENDTIPFKYVVKNVDNIKQNGELPYTKSPVDGDGSKIPKIITDFKEDFISLEGDEKANYLEQLINDNILDLSVNVTKKDGIITLTDKGIILLAKELLLYVKNHNQTIEENQ